MRAGVAEAFRRGPSRFVERLSKYPYTRFEQIVDALLSGLFTGAVAALIPGVAASVVGHSDLLTSAAVTIGTFAAMARFVADACTWYDRT